MVQCRVDENFARRGHLQRTHWKRDSERRRTEQRCAKHRQAGRDGRRAVLAGASYRRRRSPGRYLQRAAELGRMVSRAPTKALVLLVWARLSSTLQISARRPAVSSPPGFVRMFAAPPASTQPSVRAVLPPVPAPPGVRIRMLAAPKRGAAVDSYQTVAVLCNAASSTRPGCATTLGALPLAGCSPDSRGVPSLHGCRRRGCGSALAPARQSAISLTAVLRLPLNLAAFGHPRQGLRRAALPIQEEEWDEEQPHQVLYRTHLRGLCWPARQPSRAGGGWRGRRDRRGRRGRRCGRC